MKIGKMFLVLIGCIAMAACSGSSSGGGGGGGDDTGGGGGDGDDVIATAAGSVFPTDLAISSPYAQTSSAGAMVISKALADFESEREELRQIIAGEDASDCAFTLNLFQQASASPECYGPTITYFNHPDGDDNPDHTLPSNDLGIWNETQNGEACAAAKLNQVIESVASKVDSAVSIFASMGCSLNVSGSALPAAGETVDLADEFNSILSENNVAGLTVDTATLTRVADDADGHAVYDFAFTGRASQGSNSRDIELYMRHVPLDTDNATYKGKLSYIFSFVDQMQGNSAEAGSVLYSKTSATAMTHRLQAANYVANPGLAPDPLDATTKDIDPTITSTADSVHGWHDNFNYMLAAIDPQTGAGNVAYSWLAGTGSEHTRTFNATLEVDTAGGKSGCAYYGYGMPIGSGTIGEISGMICNWAGPGNQHNPNDFVQSQCVEQNANGIFITDPDTELHITYAPTNSCNSAAADNFTFYTASQTATNDHTNGAQGVTNNLLPKDEMDFTTPTVPSDVY